MKKSQSTGFSPKLIPSGIIILSGSGTDPIGNTGEGPDIDPFEDALEEDNE